MITGVEKAMKRRVIKIALAIFVVVGILVGLLAAMALDSGPEMSFSFLDGRTMTGRIEQARNSRRVTREVYSFEADFNDVCAEADAELSAMGSQIASFSAGEIADREYRLGSHISANRWILVRIRDRYRLEVFSSPESSKLDSSTYYPRKGWVSVEVRRRRLRSWPPKNFLTRLQLMWRRSANNPPPAQNRNFGPG